MNAYVLWWHSDGFAGPSLLGSPVDSFRDDGFVKVTNYGGLAVRPAFITTLEAGPLLLARAKEIAAERDRKLDAARDESKAALAALVEVPRG